MSATGAENMPEEDRSYGAMHGRMEYLRGRHEALEDRVNRIETSINLELAGLNVKVDTIMQHIAGQKGISGVTAAILSVTGTGFALLGVEVIKHVFLNGSH
jgi:hypothetical protein